MAAAACATRIWNHQGRASGAQHNSLSIMGPVLAQVLPTMTGESEGLGDGEGDLAAVHLPAHAVSAAQSDALLPEQ